MSAQTQAEFAGSKTIAEAASTHHDFSVLATVVRAADLLEILASPGPFTVFAPTDAAFSKLPAGEVDRLLKPENRVKLTSFVTSHILAGQLTVAELRERAVANAGHLVLRNVDGNTIEIEPLDGTLRVVGALGAVATVTKTDLLHSNGVIHTTDSVLAAPPC